MVIDWKEIGQKLKFVNRNNYLFLIKIRHALLRIKEYEGHNYIKKRMKKWYKTLWKNKKEYINWMIKKGQF